MVSRRTALFLSALLVLAAPLAATSVLHMNLDGLCDRADKIFRGTVVEIEKGSVVAGGGELPTITYHFEVSEDFLGNITEVKGKRVVSITMVGGGEPTADENGIRRFSALPQPPAMQLDHDYLLLTTPESAIGLSTTVGLGQGCFAISGDEKSGGEKAMNLFQNDGLYEGAVSYDQLAADIRAAIAQ